MLEVKKIERWIAILVIGIAGNIAQAQVSFGMQPVGSTATARSISVTVTVAGIVSNVEVTTLGSVALDFAKGAGALTCESATLAVNATCSESVTFTPIAPGVRIGAVVLLDKNNNVLGTTYISGIGSGGLGIFVPGNVLPVAGDGIYEGSVLDGFPACSASLNHPSSVALDGAGNLFIADKYHHRIRKVTATTGIISTIAGNGDPTYTGDQGLAVNATVNTPWGVALDGAGNLYIADTGNNVVRKIWASSGIITTVAGNGLPGTPASVGDGKPATKANLNSPQGVSLDAYGNLYIADTANHRIRKVSAITSVISSVAGNGTTNASTGAGGYAGDNGPAIYAELNFPFAVAFDADGNMYIPDSVNNVIRRVNTSGTITTFAGTGSEGYSGDGHAATSATLFSPESVVVDPAGNVYIADTQNAAIRKVSATTGLISTLAVNNVGNYFDQNGGPDAISIYGPIGLFLDSAGDLYFADSLNMRIREIQSDFVVLDFTGDGTPSPVRQGSRSAPQSQTLENDGNLPLELNVISADANSALDSTTTTCATGVPLLSVGEDCILGGVFSPSVAGNPLVANIDVTTSGSNPTLDLEIAGIATLVNSTTTTLSSSLNPSGFGQRVTFTAAVTTGATSGILTGGVTFFVDGTPVGSAVVVNNSGVASYFTDELAVGVHQVTASYTGDGSHFASTSSALSQAVVEGTSTNLVSNLNPSSTGLNVTFTATVIPPGAGVVPLAGTVVFTDLTTGAILGTKTVSALGVATLSIATLANGSHAIIAAYGGVQNQIEASTSNTLNQDVQSPATISLTSSPNPANYGSPVSFTATIASNATLAATGNVTILDGSKQIGTATLAGSAGVATFSTSILAVGTHSMTAAYAGDSSNSSAASATETQVVNQAGTAVNLSATPNPAIAGAQTTITATVKAAQAILAPTGSVTFTNGAATLGTVPLTASGTAILDSIFSVGSESIVATYSGDTDDSGSASASLALPVQMATTQAVLVSSTNPAIVDSAITFTVKVTSNGGTPSGSVTFFSDSASIGTANLGPTGSATLTLSTLPAGVHSVTVIYAGDANNSPSTTTALNQVIGTIPTATALGVSTTPGTNAQVILVASVVGSSGPEPTGSVTFMNGSALLGTQALNSSGIADITPNLPLGTFSIVAVYSGDALHTASSSQPAAVNGAPVGYDLTANPATLSMATTQNGSITVRLQSISGFTDTIGLGCASLPAAVTCHFSNVSVALAASGTATAQLTIDTNSPLSGGTSTANMRGGGRGVSLAGLMLPFSALFGLILRRFRRRNGAIISGALILIFTISLTLGGCGESFSQRSAAPGTYVIQITGTGASSDIIHYQNVTLNITK